MRTGSGGAWPRILCISPLFAPAASAEGFCATKMVQALQQSGASVTVLSSSNLYGGTFQDDSRIWYGVREVTVNVPQPLQPNAWQSVAMGMRFQTPFYARWVGAALETAQQLHETNKFDLIYSRSMPMAAHIAGFWCARKLKLPWIANINDPWEFYFYPEDKQPRISSFASRAFKFWLRRTLRNADLVTYPCEGLHGFHARLAKLDHAAEILPHIGYRPSSLSPAPQGQFRLVHAGMLGALDQTGRSANALLLGLKAFIESSADAAAHTKLVLVGPEDMETRAVIGKLGLERIVQSVGRVNYQDSLTYIASASACILIEARMKEGIFFPSKLADYLACGKPVLALSPETGTAADLARRGELIRVDHDSGAVRDAIASLYSDFQRGTLNSRNPSDQFMAQLNGSTVAEKFLADFKSMTSRPKTGRFAEPLKKLSSARS